MSFTRYKDIIDYGDTVILYLGYDNMQQFLVEKGKIHQTKFGSLKHDDIVGVKFGSKVACSRGYVHVLHPTPELWTVNLPHRTQILYSTDISMITLQLDLKPGSIVIEAGKLVFVFHSFIRGMFFILYLLFAIRLTTSYITYLCMMISMRHAKLSVTYINFLSYNYY
jgi:tRNA methyltransferase complex GCD14 subunit